VSTRSKTEESCPQADPDTTFNPGQKQACRESIHYCQQIDPSLADYDRLLERIETDQVLSKKDRRRLNDVLNRFQEERLTREERRLTAWARSELWDAHRS